MSDQATSSDVRAYFHPTTWTNAGLPSMYPVLPPVCYGGIPTTQGKGRRANPMQNLIPSTGGGEGVSMSEQNRTGVAEGVSWSEPSSGSHTQGSATHELNEGRRQWQKQWEISMGRGSAYVGAQRIWGRINTRSAPNNMIFYEATDDSIEIAMRGQNHVLVGLTKGSRHAHRQWRDAARSAGKGSEGQSIAKLYEEFENALNECKSESPHLDVDERHR